jgi:hypothetical protein
MKKCPNALIYAVAAVALCAFALTVAVLTLVVTIEPRVVHFNARFYAIMAFGMLIMSLAAVTGITSGLRSVAEKRIPGLSTV